MAVGRWYSEHSSVSKPFYVSNHFSNHFLIVRIVAARRRAMECVSGISLGQTATQFCALPQACIYGCECINSFASE